MPSTFEKKYSRESTFLTQEIWLQTSLIDLPKRFGKKDFPRPAIFIDCADGLIEIWVNIAYQDWMVANAGRAYGQNLALVQKTADLYREQLRELGEIWIRPETSSSGLRRTLKKMRAALANLHSLFYVITCEESLQAVRDAAMGIRVEDRFFVDAEIYVQKTLKQLLPDHADLIRFVTLADLEKGIDVNELLKRQQKFLFIDSSPHGPISLEEYRTNHPEISLADPIKEAALIREIRGQVAQPGKVTGRVRIVKKKNQAVLVQAGEVIISPMTTPDFLPAMKLAIAFVTDEGGITCHAAIVSRELGKPCIIGTKIATQVLKDGDLVEVDADHGIVKKLS